MNFQSNIPAEIYHGMKKCWEKEPENKPNMKDIVEILSEISERDRMEAEAQNAEEMNLFISIRKLFTHLFFHRTRSDLHSRS